MSGLTVQECFKMFPTMQFKDMEKIMGTPNFTDTDVISASAVAKYKGKFEHPLSIFYAKNNSQEFIPLLNESRQKSVMSQAGIQPQQVQGLLQSEDKNNQNSFAQMPDIPMDKSIFDINAMMKMEQDDFA